MEVTKCPDFDYEHVKMEDYDVEYDQRKYFITLRETNIFRDIKVSQKLT